MISGTGAHVSCSSCGAALTSLLATEQHREWHKRLDDAIQGLLDWKKGTLMGRVATTEEVRAEGYSAWFKRGLDRGVSDGLARATRNAVDAKSTSDGNTPRQTITTNHTHAHNAFNTSASFSSSTQGFDGHSVTCACGWGTYIYNASEPAWDMFHAHVRSSDPKWEDVGKIRSEYLELLRRYNEMECKMSAQRTRIDRLIAEVKK